MRLTLPDLRTRPSNRSMMYTSSPGTTPSAICWSLIHLKQTQHLLLRLTKQSYTSLFYQQNESLDLSHWPGETTSDLNLISLFSFDWATTDWARVSKSSYQLNQKKISLRMKMTMFQIHDLFDYYPNRRKRCSCCLWRSSKTSFLLHFRCFTFTPHHGN